MYISKDIRPNQTQVSEDPRPQTQHSQQASRNGPGTQLRQSVTGNSVKAVSKSGQFDPHAFQDLMLKLQGHNAGESLTKVNNIVLVDSAKTVKSRNANNLIPASKTQTESIIKKSSAKKSTKTTLIPKERPVTSKLISQPKAQSKPQDLRRKPSQATSTITLDQRKHADAQNY